MATDRAELTSYAFRKVRARILAESDVCIVCGHGAADAVDHIQPVAKAAHTRLQTTSRPSTAWPVAPSAYASATTRRATAPCQPSPSHTAAATGSPDRRNGSNPLTCVNVTRYIVAAEDPALSLPVAALTHRETTGVRAGRPWCRRRVLRERCVNERPRTARIPRGEPEWPHCRGPVDQGIRSRQE